MTGLDANVLVRYLVQDDRRQGRLAAKVIEGELTPDNKGLISSLVLCEVIWVLKRAYRQPKEKLTAVIRMILETDVFEVENRECAWRAYYDYDEGPADFSDYFLAEVNRSRGAERTVTFDERALKNESLFRRPDGLPKGRA